MFIDIWKKYYQTVTPLPWIVREKCNADWFRIHSLPDSKRYPESKDEEIIIIDRHNRVANDILGEGASIWICWNYYDSIAGLEGEKICDYSDEFTETTIFAAKTTWKMNIFDNLILDIATDRVDSTIFLAECNGNIYAPYDGGADIFIKNGFIDSYKDNYREWLSPYPSGL